MKAVASYYVTWHKNPPAAAWARKLPRESFYGRAALIGAFTAADIACSATALMYVSVTLYTIIKASSILWTAVGRALLGVERITWRTCCSTTAVALGVGMASFAQTEWTFFGVLLTLASSWIGPIRWILTEQMLPLDYSESELSAASPGITHMPGMREPSHAQPRRYVDVELPAADEAVSLASCELEEAPSHAVPAAPTSPVPSLPLDQLASIEHPPLALRKSPWVILYLIAPATAITALPAAVLLDAGGCAQFLVTQAWDTILAAGAWIALGSVMATSLLVCEAHVLGRTNSLIVSFIAMSKDCLLIVLSMVVLGEHLSAVNLLGVVIAMAALTLYRLGAQQAARKHTLTPSPPRTTAPVVPK